MVCAAGQRTADSWAIRRELLPTSFAHSSAFEPGAAALPASLSCDDSPVSVAPDSDYAQLRRELDRLRAENARHQYLGRWLHKLSVTAHADSAIRGGNVR
jgi:DNA-binding transcriptional regulator/RsmH inhibitor MraZ